MSISGLAQLPTWASELLATARVARLGLRDTDGHPRVQPITFAVVGPRLWSAIDGKPKRVPAERLARVRYLRADPRVALTVDRYREDWSGLAWVQVLARTELVGVDDGEDAAAALSALRDKYPQYRASPPGGPLLALAPERCLWWRAVET